SCTHVTTARLTIHPPDLQRELAATNKKVAFQINILNVLRAHRKRSTPPNLAILQDEFARLSALFKEFIILIQKEPLSSSASVPNLSIATMPEPALASSAIAQHQTPWGPNNYTAKVSKDGKAPADRDDKETYIAWGLFDGGPELKGKTVSNEGFNSDNGYAFFHRYCNLGDYALAWILMQGISNTVLAKYWPLDIGTSGVPYKSRQNKGRTAFANHGNIVSYRGYRFAGSAGNASIGPFDGVAGIGDNVTPGDHIILDPYPQNLKSQVLKIFLQQIIQSAPTGASSIIDNDQDLPDLGPSSAMSTPLPSKKRPFAEFEDRLPSLAPVAGPFSRNEAARYGRTKQRLVYTANQLYNGWMGRSQADLAQRGIPMNAFMRRAGQIEESMDRGSAVLRTGLSRAEESLAPLPRHHNAIKSKDAVGPADLEAVYPEDDENPMDVFTILRHPDTVAQQAENEVNSPPT
ncbi:MAG: hypothetical protein M1830_003763, partial [Pleopsidium flavum]